MDDDKKMRLYNCAGSRGLRVTWALAELGMTDAVELVMLPFPPRAHDKGYFAVNPLGTVPALKVGGELMTESSAICQYLAENFGAGALDVAPGSVERAGFLDLLHHADATLTFPQTVYMRFALFERDKGLGEAGEAYGTWFARRLQKIDARLATREYLCDARFTIADIAIGYALYLATRIGLSHHLSPRLVEYLGQLQARAGFAAALAWEKDAAVRAGLGNLTNFLP